MGREQGFFGKGDIKAPGGRYINVSAYVPFSHLHVVFAEIPEHILAKITMRYLMNIFFHAFEKVNTGASPEVVKSIGRLL
jgi:hypothetical protein